MAGRFAADLSPTKVSDARNSQSEGEDPQRD
jgi:hypothetical protein